MLFPNNLQKAIKLWLAKMEAAFITIPDITDLFISLEEIPSKFVSTTILSFQGWKKEDGQILTRCVSGHLE